MGTIKQKVNGQWELIHVTGEDVVQMKDDLSSVTSQLAEKATKTELTNSLVPKTDKTYVDTELGKKSDKTYVDSQLSNKRDTSTPLMLADLHTEVKTAMTGGSVPVVGLKAVGYENLKENSITAKNTVFAKLGKNKFGGIFEKGVIISDGTYRSDANGMLAVMPITGGNTYYFAKDFGDRNRVAFMKTAPVLGETASVVDYYIGDVAQGSAISAPVDAKYLLLYVSQTQLSIKLQITEGKSYPFFLGYDVNLTLESESVGIDALINSPYYKAVFKTVTGLLYGNKPLLKIDYTAKTVTVPSGSRMFYNGKRTVISNTVLNFPTPANVLSLVFNPTTSALELKDVTVGTTLDEGLVLLAIINPINPEIYGIDIENCEINGKMFVHSQTTQAIDDKIKPIQDKVDLFSQTSKYYFLDDIDGVYEKPAGLANVASGQSFVLESSLHTDIYAIYDDLVARYPNYVTKTLLGNEPTGLPIYQYKFTSPSIDNQSSFPYRKLKMVVTSAIHGYEQGSAWCLAQFFKDLCDNYSTKKQLEFMRWNVDFVVVPVCNPYGFDHNQRTNSNGVDLNRNFNANWTLTTADGDVNGYYSGPSAASEVETQIIQSFLDANVDAEYIIDYHNIASGYPLFYLYDSAASTIALNTFKVLTRKWKTDYPNAPQDATMFGYIKTGVNASISKYSLNKGIKSFTFETPWRMPFGSAKYDKTTIETGVECFGNTLVTVLKSLK